MISVCLATHNGEKYIKNQLDSILNQLDDNDEVIVSDDGSTDKTIQILLGYNDPRIHICNYKQPSVVKHPHEYVCRNFENALKHVKGDYIFLSDQDDEWMPNKVEKCISVLRDCDLLVHDFYLMNENGDITSEQPHHNGKYRFRNYLMRDGKPYGCAMAFRRDVLKYVLPFPKHLLLHDYWIGILVETLGKMQFVDEPLIKYRIHHQNTSSTSNSLLYKIMYRIKSICHLTIRVLKIKFGL